MGALRRGERLPARLAARLTAAGPTKAEYAKKWSMLLWLEEMQHEVRLVLQSGISRIVLSTMPDSMCCR